jgi:hypothetical protein
MTPRSRPKTFIDFGNIRLNIAALTREKTPLICPTGKSVACVSGPVRVQPFRKKYFA